jgi:hypothetical protein
MFRNKMYLCLLTSASLSIVLAMPLPDAYEAPTMVSERNERQGWYSAPNYRSTVGILLLCFSTIVLCCWTAFHPDVPHPASGWLEQYMDRTFGLLAAITFPECFLYVAFYEWMDAKASMKAVSNAVLGNHWTVTHSFFGNMGGFAVEVPRKGWNDRRAIRLNADVVRKLLGDRIDLNTLPSQKEIADKGKADGVVKLITVLQILCMVVQSIARRVQNLPLTTLEVSTIAYIPCALLAYILWWHKPYDVSVPIVLPLKSPQQGYLALDIEPRNCAEPREMPVSWHCKHTMNIGIRRNLTALQEVSTVEYRTFETTRQSLEMLRSSLMPVGAFGFSSAFIFVMVGGIHLAAWNFNFPSSAECWAWRVCSLVITVIMPISWLITAVFLRLFTGRWWDGTEDGAILRQYRALRRIGMGIQGLALVMYTLARLYLLAEVFAALRSSPQDIYKTPDWSRWLPHFG